MAYFSPYIDGSGLHTPSYDEIKEYLMDKMKEIYGNDIYLDNDSQDYQLLSTFSLMLYDANQLAIYVYNNMNPITAVGASLDRLVSINGISRKVASPSSAKLTITGNPGTVLNYCSAKDINGLIWQLDPYLVIPESGILLADAFCIEIGSIQAAANTINIIATPTQGWVSVNNENAAIPGSPVETDSELKARRQTSISLPSKTIFEGIIANISQLVGVTKVMGYENDASEYKGVLPPHSISVIAEGGSDEQIANIIYLRKTPGTSTFGSTSVSLEGLLGTQNIIKFSRPEYKNLSVDLTIKKLDNWNDALIATIKQNIVDYVNEMRIGENLYVINLSTPIISANPDFTKLSFYMTTILVDEQSEIVDVGDFELAKLDINDITITAL